MKRVFYPLFLMILVSCSGTYYQIYKVKPDNATSNGKAIIFEDTICIVSYNLWTHGGNPGFVFYNKSDKEITLLLRECFYILNDRAYDYYRNRTYTNSISLGKISKLNSYSFFGYTVPSVEKSSSTGQATSYSEKEQIVIPPKTKKYFTEYVISSEFYNQCELKKFPGNNNVKTWVYTKNNTPFAFYNYLTYISKGDTIKSVNNFYVNEITNIPESQAFERIKRNECGIKFSVPIKVLKNESPDSFYLIYHMNKK
ncbi:MAG: hypothetical protein IPO49_13590 [Bacteroidetes bacterium]|nr:hypothetical protein [Bacteroidota bacterium]